MNYKKLISCFILVILSGTISLKAETESFNFNFVSEKKLEVGEVLSYVVKYAFISLGEITFKIIDKSEFKNKNLYRTEAYIDSYSNIPFVDIHQIYKSILSSDYYSVYFKGITRSEEYNTYAEYNFNYDSSFIHIKKGYLDSNKIIADSILRIKEFYQDGLSLFYYARMKSGKNKSEKLNCFVNEKKVTTNINFYDEAEEVSIDVVDYPIKCVKVDGSFDYVSIYGLTGDFEGWFTDDEAAIPVLAKMQVMIGSVSIELREWERKGWNPPEFKE